MKIQEILEGKNGKPVSLGGGFSTQMKQRIDPDTLQALANYRNYQSDVNKVSPSPSPKKRTYKDYKGGTPDWDSYHFSNVYFLNKKISLPNDFIEKTKDINDVYDVFIKYNTTRLPLEIKNEIKNDPEWQNVVQEFWKQAQFGAKGNRIKKDIHLKKKDDKYKTWDHTSVPAVTAGGGDISEVRYLEKKLTDAINKILRKHGIDNTGRKMIYK